MKSDYDKKKFYMDEYGNLYPKKGSKHGWVIEVTPKNKHYYGKDQLFYSMNVYSDYALPLNCAYVMPTREYARELKSNHGHEVVRKVILNSKGEPVAIIGRG